MTATDTVIIVRLKCTCTAAPSQWEGRCSDGDHIYLRFRHEEFSVYKAPDLFDDVTPLSFAAAVIYTAHDPRLALDDDEMIELLPAWITLLPGIAIQPWA